ncbi:MAG TPA: OB-fold domain-containing protein [Syntrophales bacterium]|nr:OB-fold domain-containing protein [Syntrophales bacterium]
MEDRKGTLYTYTVIHSAMDEFKSQVPYVVGLLEEEDGKRTVARVEGYRIGKPIRIGMTVACSRVDENGRRVYRFID